MPNLYALLAGVNTYHPHTDNKVPNLQGCVNDIRGLQQFLEDRFSNAQRNIVTLVDSDATYQNVVDHFGSKLLAGAGKGDTVLFAYSGHGSQEPAAPEFSTYYPGGLEETLVLYDSRIPGGLDLADKELAILIERVALQGAQVVVLLDCCHSGSGTRSAEDFVLGAARQASNRNDPRALDTYLQGAYLKRPYFYLPNSRHILLAACDRTEKAFELSSQRGLFSAKLMEVLEKTNARISYADLALQCRVAMGQVTDRQHPRFETYGYFNGYDGFLGLSAGSAGAPLRIFFGDQVWQASMGAVHGLPVASGNAAAFEVLKDGQVLGQVRSRVVGPEASSLETPDLPLDTAENYEARLTSLTVPKTIYRLQAGPAEGEKVRKALERFDPLHFDLREDALQAACSLQVDPDQIQLIRNQDGLRLRTIKGEDWEKMLSEAFEKLEQIARWEKTVALDNRDTKIGRDAVELVLVELDGEGGTVRETVVSDTPEKEVVVDILRTDNGEQAVPFRVEVRNKNGEKARHCALFYAGENYDFQPVGYNELVPPLKTALAMDKDARGKQETLFLTDARTSVAKPESLDILKLFVSNVRINGEGLQQPGFRLGETVHYPLAGGAMRGAKEAIAEARLISSIYDEQEEAEDVNDWYTLTLRLKCVARQATVGEQPIALAGNFIKIHPHPAFRSGLAIGSVSPGSRGLEPMAVMADLARRNGVTLLPFGETTRDVAPLNMLELSDIQNEASLIGQPLQIEVAAQLQESAQHEDLLLPLTFDGEHLIPVGTVERLDNGNALISIEQLPDTPDNRRSIAKALKLCFMKLVLKKEDVQQLCWVDYSRSMAERRSENLSDKVAAAQNILLVTHGIIGDTQGMADCMRPACDGQLFDLVLTFDYENLNTKVEVTAGKLGDKLREAGITPESGKKITILAHSLGGLVTRYFIENLQGNKVVKHLIMAGTPNAGSAIAKVTGYRDFMLPLLTLAINSPWSIPAAATLLAIFKGSKIITPTLEQMDYDNANGFLKNMAKAPDPGIRYSILAGDLQQYMEANADQRKLMDKLYGLGGKLFYKDLPNDLAVSVESIKSVPLQRQPAPESVVLPGNHMNYFEEKGCVAALMGFLK